MPLHAEGSEPSRQDGQDRQPQPLQCGRCGTTSQLTVTSITELDPPVPSLVAVSYICVRCGTFRFHPVLFLELAAAQTRGIRLSDLLIFGNHYLHCGHPMEKADPDLRRLSATYTQADQAQQELDVYLSTRVLRCDCGFQIELPA